MPCSSGGCATPTRWCGRRAIMPNRTAGRGYCVFGNLVLMVRHAQRRHGLGRVAVVDWDVHHGNGTESAFIDDPSVLTLSIHQERCYPVDSGRLHVVGTGRGAGTNLNIPLPPGSGHGAYLAAFDRVVLPALHRFRPELIVIASGLDASAMDPLGRMLCTSETYRAMAGARHGGRGGSVRRPAVGHPRGRILERLRTVLRTCRFSRNFPGYAPT